MHLKVNYFVVKITPLHFFMFLHVHSECWLSAYKSTWCHNQKTTNWTVISDVKNSLYPDVENKVVFSKLFGVVLRIDINYTFTCIKTKWCTDVCIILKNPLTAHVYLQVMCCPCTDCSLCCIVSHISCWKLLIDMWFTLAQKFSK